MIFCSHCFESPEIKAMINDTNSIGKCPICGHDDTAIYDTEQHEHLKGILDSAHVVVMNKEEASMATGIQVRPDTKTEKFSQEVIHQDI